MTLYKCKGCGVKIAGKGIMKQIESLVQKGHLSKKTWREAKREIESEEDPYIRCENCGSLFEVFKK